MLRHSNSAPRIVAEEVLKMKRKRFLFFRLAYIVHLFEEHHELPQQRGACMYNTVGEPKKNNIARISKENPFFFDEKRSGCRLSAE